MIFAGTLGWRGNGITNPRLNPQSGMIFAGTDQGELIYEHNQGLNPQSGMIFAGTYAPLWNAGMLFKS